MNRNTRAQVVAGLESSPLLDQRSVMGGDGSMLSVLAVLEGREGARWATVVTEVSDASLAHLRPRMELAGMRAVGSGNWRHRKVPITTTGKGEGGGPTRIMIREGCAVEQVWEWVEVHPQGGGRFRNLRTRMAMVPPPAVTPMWMDAALAAPVLLTVIPAVVAAGRLDALDQVDVEAGNGVLDGVLAEAARSFSLWAGLVAADFGEER